MKVFEGLTSLFKESDDDELLEEDGYLASDSRDDEMSSDYDTDDFVDSKSDDRYSRSRSIKRSSDDAKSKKGIFSVFKSGKEHEKFSDSDEDFFDEDFSVDIYEDEIEAPSAKHRKKTLSRSADDESVFKGSHRFDGSDDEPPSHTGAVKPRRSRNVSGGNIVQMSKASVDGLAIKCIHPESMEQCNEITDALLDGHVVILNLEGISPDVAQRIIDFTSGSCYAMRGELQKASSYMFIVAPSNVEIAGDFQDMFHAVDLDMYKNSFNFRGDN